MKLKITFIIFILLFSLASVSKGQSDYKWEKTAKISNLETFNRKKIFFIDDKNAWLVSVGGKVVLKSEDGGKIWNKKQVPNGVFYGVYFSDNNHGWLSGSKDGKLILYETENGGKTWKSDKISDGGFEASRLGEIQFANQRTGWVIGNVFENTRQSGSVFKTDDGGKTWQLQPLGNSNDGGFNTLEVVDENTVFIGGMNSIIKTNDGGKTWKNSFDEKRISDIRDIKFVSPNEGWAVGFQNDVLHTIDGGVSWTNLLEQFQRDSADVRNLLKRRKFPLFAAIKFITPQQGWIGGGGGLIFSTADGGKTWLKEETGSNSFIQELEISDSFLFAVGDDNLLLKRLLKSCH